MSLVKHTVNYIYNLNGDSALFYIDSVQRVLPNHPVIPMMRGMKVLWENVPLVTVDSIFKEFRKHMGEVIRLAGRLDGERQEHPEAIFFEMAARGLLAEYYADDDQYMKAVSEASKTYQLLKMGFELQEEVPEFLFTSGLYNYFREKYPERNPIYRSFLWLFRSGDIEKGLKQLEEACKITVISKVEANVYLAYIYLRYEFQPLKAQKYLIDLYNDYPENLYINAKLLESLADGKNFEEASPEMIERLMASDRPYYQMAGKTFKGLYLEQIKKDKEQALKVYRQSITAGSSILGHGEYYRSLSFLGMGRIFFDNGDLPNAEYHLKQSLKHFPTQVIKDEVDSLLQLM